MSERALLGPDGRPVPAPEITAVFTRSGQATDPVPVRRLHHHDSQPEDEPDLLEHCEWISGPAGPLGIYSPAAGLWLVIDALSGEVIGGGAIRADVLDLVRDLHAQHVEDKRERAYRRELGRENYYRKQGTY